MKTAYDIIIKPVITEQSMEATEDKKYVFQVAIDANKVEIKKAVEEIFGVNFNLFYLMLVKHIREVLKNEELRSYLIICLVATGAVALSTYKTFDGFEHCLRTSFFQVTSIISTTGFSTTDFNLWHIFPKTVLTVLMFIGACAGSTAGGLKVSRVMILFKSIRREIKHMLKPRSVNSRMLYH